MQIFIDSADAAELKTLAQTGLVDGVTTNPSLVAKAGRDFFETLAEICAAVPGPVSAEVVAQDAETMIKEGLKLRGDVTHTESPDAFGVCTSPYPEKKMQLVDVSPEWIDKCPTSTIAADGECARHREIDRACCCEGRRDLGLVIMVKAHRTGNANLFAGDRRRDKVPLAKRTRLSRGSRRVSAVAAKGEIRLVGAVDSENISMCRATVTNDNLIDASRGNLNPSLDCEVACPNAVCR